MLSVIVPFHNASSFLKECLNCIKSQTIQNDYEVLFINDGSTDDSEQIFNKYNFDNTKIKLINITKSGVSKARNIGISRSKGDYVCFLDIDDVFSVDLFETYINYIKKNNDIFYIYDYCEQIGTTKRNIHIYENNSDEKYIPIEFIIGLILGKYNNEPFFASVWRICIKKAFILKNNIFFKEDIYIAEDTLFYLECFKCLDKVFYVPKTLYTYVRRFNSSLNIYRPNFLDMQIKFHNYFLECLESIKQVDDELFEYYKVNKFTCYTALLSNEARSNLSYKQKKKNILNICKLFKHDTLALKSYEKLSKVYKLVYRAMKYNFSFTLLFLFSFKEKVRLWKLKKTN